MQHLAHPDGSILTMPKLRSSQRISIGQVRAFVAAATHRSISDAARQLRMSQPTLSRCIKDMESSLETVLFERTPRGVVLSADGERLLSKARRLLGAHKEALAAVDGLRRSNAARLNLIGSFGVLPIVLPTLLGKLKQAQRSMSIKVEEATTSEVLETVKSGEAPMGVCVDRPDSQELRSTTVLDAPLGLLVNEGMAPMQTIQSLDDLGDLPMIRYGEQARVTRLLAGHCPGLSAYFSSPVAVGTVQAAAELVRAGGLVAIVSGIAASHPQMRGLRFIPLAGLLPSAGLTIVSRRRETFDAQAECMRELLRDSIWEAPWHPSVRRAGPATPRPHAAQCASALTC